MAKNQKAFGSKISIAGQQQEKKNTGMKNIQEKGTYKYKNINIQQRGILLAAKAEVVNLSQFLHQLFPQVWFYYLLNVA